MAIDSALDGCVRFGRIDLSAVIILVRMAVPPPTEIPAPSRKKAPNLLLARAIGGKGEEGLKKGKSSNTK